jgi:hypothetical protein
MMSCASCCRIFLQSARRTVQCRSLQAQAEAERRELIGQIESRAVELRGVQAAFFKQLQSTQREIGALKDALRSGSSTADKSQLEAEVAALRALLEAKAAAVTARITDIMTTAETTTHRVVEAARGDTARFSGESRALVGVPP